MNSKNTPNILMMTRYIKKGDRIYPSPKDKPVAVAEEDFSPNDIGEIDYSVTYPVCIKKSLILLPGLKKNLHIKGKNQLIKMEKKCQKRKKRE